MREPKIRISKRTGEPTPASAREYKNYIKTNFDKIDKNFINEKFTGYYRQVEGGKNRAANSYKDPNTGLFLTKGQSAVIKEAVENFAKDKGLKVSDIKSKPDLMKPVFLMATKKEYSNLIPSAIISDMVKDKRIQKVVIIDQNGNRKTVSPEKAILMIIQANKIIAEHTGGKTFDARNKVTLKDLKSTIEIFVPNLKNLSDEEIEDLLNETDGEDYEVSYRNGK
jgi:hypothetical protein